ncbi:MAG: helix-turn-helix transcriptional regulator [Chitinophagales bacterium]|nr:helix-turn-helix transcriptional regulator [Bacteroidota bacterium]MCB9042178.1 helix-turn-helix transcriptional regulator [Chitinophagales bacterium]
MIREENIRLIFGLKVKQLREAKQFSLAALSKLSGLSASYLNEIEKGKKYPKTEKIIALANALDINYNELISLELPPKLEKLGDLLTSNLITDLPLDMFGLDFGRMIEWMTNDPVKFGAFIGTITEIARKYDLEKEHFYFAALRSYQEFHDNYFQELEDGVDFFIEKYQVDTQNLHYEFFENILKQKFNYKIQNFSPEKYPALADVRYVFLPDGKKNYLFLNPRLNFHQKSFVIGREITFNILKATDRPQVSVMITVPSFEHVLNNFKASYCTAALLIPRQRILDKLKDWLAQKEWNATYFMEMMAEFPVSSELFLFRLASMLPKFFGINDLYLLRFQHHTESDHFDLTRELHLSDLQRPLGTEMLQHYCRRWVSIKTLQALQQAQNGNNATAQTNIQVQRSKFMDTGDEFLNISVARTMDPTPFTNSSATLGLKLNDELRRQLRFYNDAAIPQVQVNHTCETCPITDCKERVAPSSIFEEEQQNQRIKVAIQKLSGELP